jgi:hypothetical protein
MKNDQSTGIIYNDVYGVWTEDDQTRVAGEALALMDAQKTAADEQPSD